MTQRVHDLLLWLSAADRRVLRDCPEGEEHRFVAAGGAVLATTGMAVLAGVFTFATLLHVPLAPAALLGVAFGLLVMNLERYVQASLRRQRHPVLTIASGLPRIALSFLMGMLIAIPLMLAIFSSEVGKQVVVDRNAALREARAELDRQFDLIPRLTQERSRLQAQNATIEPGVVLRTSPQYRALARRIDRLKRWVRDTRDPKLIRSYEREINRLGPEIRSLRATLLADESAAIAATRRQRQARIDEITPQLERLTRERDARDAELASRFDGAPGLAAHLTALDHVADAQPGVGAMKDVLVVFLVAVDSLPAVLLTLMLVGRATAYEEAQDAEERVRGRLAAEAETARVRATAQQAGAHADAQTELAAARLARQVALQREMDDIYLGIVGDALRPATERMAREAAAAYVRGVENAGAVRTAHGAHSLNGGGARRLRASVARWWRDGTEQRPGHQRRPG